MLRADLSPNAQRAWAQREADAAAQGEQTSVLLLRNVSKSLTLEDLRRLIPQGEHLEGWTLEQGSITRIVPARDLATLQHQGTYYLLFKSALSAFAYQGHATRISRLVTEHTPNSLHNSIPPPPGYMLDGMDVNAAIEAYTLTPATQRLTLRQLKPPLAPVVNAIVRDGGYPALIHRKDKMPFELRLTLEGPQLPMTRIRYIMHESSRDRALGWSGGEGNNVKISQWEPIEHTSDQARSVMDKRATENPAANVDAAAKQVAISASRNVEVAAVPRELEQPRYLSNFEEKRRRTPHPVYILGFHTEHAAQSFMRYWHRRPMDWKGEHMDEEGDIPPITNVEILW
jgi:hypothetical protein